MNLPLIIHKNLQEIHTPSMLSSIPPLEDDEEDVSYDVKSLTTNIPIEETINYIIEQIYVHKNVNAKLCFGKTTIYCF